MMKDWRDRRRQITVTVVIVLPIGISGFFTLFASLKSLDTHNERDVWSVIQTFSPHAKP